eukprot:UN11034
MRHFDRLLQPLWTIRNLFKLALFSNAFEKRFSSALSDFKPFLQKPLVAIFNSDIERNRERMIEPPTIAQDFFPISQLSNKGHIDSFQIIFLLIFDRF